MNLPELQEGRMVYLEAIAVAIYQCAEQRPAGSVYFESDAEWYRGYALLALAKGEAVTPEDIHDAWTAGVIRKLTPYGAAAHPFCVPYPDLPEEVQRWDDAYAETIQGICRIARILQGVIGGRRRHSYRCSVPANETLAKRSWDAPRGLSGRGR